MAAAAAPPAAVPPAAAPPAAAQADNEFWVFGYGSLCWNPGFEYKDSMMGYVQGFSRKFWQGNIAHRGTKEKPGRVATLVKNDQGHVWGQAFLLPDETAFRYLEMREVFLGGYEVHMVNVRSENGQRTVNATVYVATPSSNLWLGEMPLDELAAHVATCSGPAGHNAEYVLMLARWERQFAPADRQDPELSSLEHMVEERLAAAGMRAQDVFVPERTFKSMVPEKRLRCLNII